MTKDPAPALWVAAAAGAIAGAVVSAGMLMLAVRSGIGHDVVRSALREQPQMLVEAGEALRDRQHAPVIAAQRAALTTPYGSSWKGSEAPDVVLVEFFDYACGYCKASNADIDRLLAEDKGLRVVYREWPILGEASVVAARLSLTASQAGRFRQFHDTLFAAGRPSPETLQAAARAAGVGRAPADSPAHEAELRRNFELAQALGGTGTPLFVVGDRVLNGAVGYDTLKSAIAEAREKAKS